MHEIAGLVNKQWHELSTEMKLTYEEMAEDD